MVSKWSAYFVCCLTFNGVSEHFCISFLTSGSKPFMVQSLLGGEALIWVDLEEFTDKVLAFI